MFATILLEISAMQHVKMAYRDLFVLLNKLWSFE